MNGGWIIWWGGRINRRKKKEKTARILGCNKSIEESTTQCISIDKNLI
jgi:hypothetical protein